MPGWPDPQQGDRETRQPARQREPPPLSLQHLGVSLGMWGRLGSCIPACSAAGCVVRESSAPQAGYDGAGCLQYCTVGFKQPQIRPQLACMGMEHDLMLGRSQQTSLQQDQVLLALLQH